MSTSARSNLVVVLTPMQHDHLPEVLRIEAQAYPRPWSEGLFKGELALTGSRVYAVATVADAVVGYAGALYIAGEAHVTTVAVDEQWRRHAIATRLVLLLVEAAIERGIDQMTLEVRVSNTGARDLYRRFGFAPAGVRKNYYPETNEDALVMWAHELGSPAYAERLDAVRAAIPGRTTVVPAVAGSNPEVEV
ncbi:MAG TPA: ribosomal protein S18-alanine N-acetyltransferase [Acidimicrobiales bacterium]|nr:ribosomal protein S18-alanine N-acetyltransferase [Acidimicrobiales bacterium]